MNRSSDLSKNYFANHDLNVDTRATISWQWSKEGPLWDKIYTMDWTRTYTSVRSDKFLFYRRLFVVVAVMCSNIGKISAQPHTIVKQICFPNGNLLSLSLFSLSKNWMHNVVWGCAEILPQYQPTNTIFIVWYCSFTAFHLFSSYRGWVLILTFFAYTSYHLSRKPISVVKVRK